MKENSPILFLTYKFILTEIINNINKVLFSVYLQGKRIIRIFI